MFIVYFFVRSVKKKKIITNLRYLEFNHTPTKKVIDSRLVKKFVFANPTLISKARMGMRQKKSKNIQG